jgi:Zn-dependent protease with chaperone function
MPALLATYSAPIIAADVALCVAVGAPAWQVVAAGVTATVAAGVARMQLFDDPHRTRLLWGHDAPEDHPVRAAVAALVAAGAPAPASVGILPSGEPCAYLLQRSDARRLTVTTALANGNARELVGVVAHELQHLRHRTVARTAAVISAADVVAGGSAALLLYRRDLVGAALARAGVVAGYDLAVALGVALALGVCCTTVSVSLSAALCRWEERIADRAARRAGFGRPLANLLERLADGPSGCHPSAASRARRLRRRRLRRWTRACAAPAQAHTVGQAPEA